jgi:putative transposase
MARKLRIQYPGALYHVINRGNYRRDLFENVGAAQAFLRVLQETKDRYGWIVHAYVLMRNHYHLAIETPQPTLVDGMHWLQSTLATRFNRLRHENGHLFQGRYQAILIENASALVRVVDYIQLNPVRAGIIGADKVKTYRWSSLPGILKGTEPIAQAAAWLHTLGLPDNATGRLTYESRLIELGRTPERWEELGLVNLSKGYAIGTRGWRQSLAQEYGHLALHPGLQQAEVQELREEVWTQAMHTELKALGRSTAALATRPSKQPWKLELARRLRMQTSAPIGWLAKNLQLGQPASLRSYLCRLQQTNNHQTTA